MKQKKGYRRLLNALVISCLLSGCTSKIAMCKFAGESDCRINYFLPPDALYSEGYDYQIWVTGEFHNMHIKGNYDGESGICRVVFECDNKPTREIIMPIPERRKNAEDGIGLYVGR